MKTKKKNYSHVSEEKPPQTLFIANENKEKNVEKKRKTKDYLTKANETLISRNRYQNGPEVNSRRLHSLTQNDSYNDEL